MSGEFAPTPPEYTVIELPRLQEGDELSSVAHQVVAMLHNEWVGTGDPDEEELEDIREVLSGNGATIAVTDAEDVVVATASYKLNTFPWAEHGWATLHGVAVVPEQGGDQSGDTQRDVALQGIEGVARRNGVTRLATETDTEIPETVDYYRTRGYTLLEESRSGRPELFKDLQL